ncbi:unnamed protein product [Phytomonas sp. Hart1]|nr:unnamed protein product [Phytomonas sp. Hart1]|eukprot:CCW69138.1 unnamed protein product [Phytomonas sp. isolate Hart1]
MSTLHSNSSHGTLSSLPSLGPLSHRSAEHNSLSNSSSRRSHRGSGLVEDIGTQSGRGNPPHRASARKTDGLRGDRPESKPTSASNKPRGGGVTPRRPTPPTHATTRAAESSRLTHPPKSASSVEESNKENINQLAKIERRYEHMKPSPLTLSGRLTVTSARGSARCSTGIQPASARQLHKNFLSKFERPPTARRTTEVHEMGPSSVRHLPMPIVSPRTASASANGEALTTSRVMDGNTREMFFRQEYVFFPEDGKNGEKARSTQSITLTIQPKQAMNHVKQILPKYGKSNGENIQKTPRTLNRSERKGDSNKNNRDPVEKADSSTSDADVAEGEPKDLKARICTTRRKLARVESDMKRYTETLYQRETEKNMKESILKELKQQVENYDECYSTACAMCRKFEVQCRSQEELDVLRDMTEERKVRLENIQQKSDSLNSQWNQLQLLHEENSRESEDNQKANSESPMKDMCDTDECTDRHNDCVSLPSPTASKTAQVQREFSLFSNNTCNVLNRFLKDLLAEVEELTKTCIQVPSPSDSSRVSQGNRNGRRSSIKGSNGFFSFFGGATEQHLSAKPLSTFLSGISRLERSAWRMEEEVQLRARELANVSEEEELRDKFQVFSVLSGTNLTSQHSKVLMTPNRTVNIDQGSETEGKQVVEFSTPLTPLQTSSQKLQHLQNSPEFLPCSPIRDRNNVVAAARDIMESNGSPSHIAPSIGTISMKPQELSYVYPRLRDASHDMDFQQLQIRVDYEKEVEKQRSKVRLMAKKLRDAYRTQIEPLLRTRITELKQQQVLMAHELRDLGIAEVHLEREGQWFTTENIDSTETCDYHDEGFHNHDACERGKFKEYSSNDVNGRYSSVQSMVGYIDTFSPRRVHSSAARSFSQRQKPTKLVNCVTVRTLQLAADFSKSQRGDLSLNTSVCTAYESRKSKCEATAMRLPSRTGTLSSRSEGGSHRGCMTPLFSARAANDVPLNNISSVSARAPMPDDLPPSSSRARLSTGTILVATPRKENSMSSITASDPKRSLQSVSPITKTSPWLKCGRGSVLLRSPRGPLAVSTPTSVRASSRVQGATVAPKSRSLAVNPEESTRDTVSSIFIEETLEPQRPTPHDVQTHLWGVHPDYRPDLQLERGAVKVTLLFYGQEARRRRALEERNTELSKGLWSLREELARLEEDAYNQRRALEELEANYLTEKESHAASLLEAQNNLKDSRQCFLALKREYEEWDTIRQELNSLVTS